MFAYIKGILEEKSINYVIAENCGIGYKIFMSAKAIGILPDIHNEVKVYTYYHVREDNISLYGFNTKEELRMFELLISVSGIGTKSAIAMLSEITPSEFALAVISDDVSKLVNIPGIGKKTAARIILELKDKIKSESIQENEDNEKEVVNETNKNEAISALQVLGYSKKEIEQALKTMDTKNMSIEEIIKQGLKYLAKN